MFDFTEAVAPICESVQAFRVKVLSSNAIWSLPAQLVLFLSCGTGGEALSAHRGCQVPAVRLEQ